MSRFTRPRALQAGDPVARFVCGEPSLDDYLRRKAWKNHTQGAARCFVTFDDDGGLAGYYTLSAGSVVRASAPGAVRRNMPDPVVPALLMGRLAVAAAHQGRHLGADLLHDAIARTAGVAQTAGIRVLLVHALHEQARRFYLRYDFLPAPNQPMTLMLLLKDLSS